MAEKNEFDVLDPEVLKPKALPLIVQPAGGVDVKKPFDGWKNKAQQEFSKIVNAYAYQNPEKWKAESVTPDVVNPLGGFLQKGGAKVPSKKERLLEKLSALGGMPDIPENPDAPKITINGSKVK